MSDEKIKGYYITVTSGMRGFFAVMIVEYVDGFYEPQQTSPSSFKDSEGARRDAKSWAEAEELPLR